MKLLPLLLTWLFIGCSHQKPAVEPDHYLKLNKAHTGRHKACKEQNKEIFAKAITENEDAELDDENYFFVRSEKRAISLMKKVNLSKLTLKENQLEYEALIKGCEKKRDPAYSACDTHGPPMKYYRGLIYALRQYDWSSPTQELALKHILQYIKHVAESKSTLINLAIASDLLARLGNLGYVTESLRVQTVDFRHEIEAIHEALNQKIVKMSQKKHGCQDTVQIFQEEKAAINDMSDRFLMMLRNAQ